MASDTKNVKLGPCSVYYKPKDGVETDLGYTKGGVEVTVETSTHEVNVDQFGETPINELIMSRSITVSVPLAETTLDNLVLIMPGAKKESNAVTVTTAVGTSLLDIAGTLRLRPQGNIDASEDLTIFKAATPGGINFSYQVDEERVFTAEFKGYPDSTNGNQLFAMGDIGSGGA